MVFNDFLLNLVLIKGYGSVMRSSVGSLLVEKGRVVGIKKNFYKGGKIDFIRVIDNLYRLSMTCSARDNLVIGWIFGFSSGKPE